MRGGSWNNQADNLRCAARNYNNPDNNWNNNIGFRLVCVQSCPNFCSCNDAGISRNAGRVCGHDMRLSDRRLSSP
ncbi:MAG: hypothetical protein ACE5HX_11195 [bacterium]